MADLLLGQHPLLKKAFIDQRIRDLVGHQFVADQLFMGSTVDALSIKYYQDADVDANGRYSYEEVPETGERSGFKRIGISEEEKQAFIRKYGLEAAISYEMQKWGQPSAFERVYRKLALSVKKMVDTMAYNTILNEPNKLGKVKSGGYWNTAGTGADDMINDLIDAKTAGKPYAYAVDTVVMSPRTEALLLKNKSIRDAFRVNNTDLALLRGYIGDFLGLSFITDENFPDDKVLVLQKKIIGDIADAEPLKSKTYNEEQNNKTIVQVTRYVQAYITDPKAIYVIDNIEN